MLGFLQPKEQLKKTEIEKGLKTLTLDGVTSQVMGSLTGGPFLVAFALILGASNFLIGLLAAVGPLTQLLQLPTILLVEKVKKRKALVVISSFFSRLFWFLVALSPVLFLKEHQALILIICVLCYYGFGTISGCSFNSWMRDFVPQNTMGSYYSKRLAIATTAGALVTVAAGFGVEFGLKKIPNPSTVYSILFLCGGMAGLFGVYFLSRIPEPRMQPSEDLKIFNILLEPFREKNFRNLLVFLGSWNFAINLAGPFFVVYMLKRLGMPMSWVVGLSVLSQVGNIFFFQIWGRLSDRFSNKSVLAVSGPLFIISIALWPFTTMPEKYFLTIPLLIVIHLLAGISTAGVNLCASNIAIKAAPKGKATAYLATNAIVNGVAATLAPIAGGVAADIFQSEILSFNILWITSEKTRFAFDALNVKGLDFLFIIAVLLGFYALHRLLAVKEEGEVDEDIVVSQLYGEVRSAVRNVSNVAGIRHLTYFPYGMLKRVLVSTIKLGGTLSRSNNN